MIQKVPDYALQSIRKTLEKHIRLTSTEFEIFSKHISMRTLRKRQFLFQAGDICRYNFYVVKGCVRMYEIDEAGRERILHFATETWWTGDLYSYLTGQPTSFYVECLEDTEIIQIESQCMEILYTQLPKLERFFRILVQNSLVAVHRRLLSVMSRSAAERYCEFVQRYPNLEQRIANHQIAAYLGIAPESLSRLRKEYLSKKI
jgi:CRP-like cAMP-binding protein